MLMRSYDRRNVGKATKLASQGKMYPSGPFDLHLEELNSIYTYSHGVTISFISIVSYMLSNCSWSYCGLYGVGTDELYMLHMAEKSPKT